MKAQDKGRINFLKKIVEVQNITLEHTARGCTQIWVYRKIIYPRFFISLKTYYRWLGEPVKKELAELEEKITYQIKS
ncbi:MAG: hypothetical protein LBK94_13155 [Prevotellaceae bacterium]|nr:hypothetical protein [Prevotellaceae bacterium]